MIPYRRLAFVSLTLAIAGIATPNVRLSIESIQAPSSLALIGFLIGLPALLGGVLLLGYRWSLMAAVFYGTTGLALDLSTIIQLVPQSESVGKVFLSMMTGILNTLLIVWGGKELLKVMSFQR